MSLMDKLKSIFSGGSPDAADAHAGHDHAGHDHSHEPVAPPMPPADPTGMPTSEEGDPTPD
jgi:hypothetical protein